MRHILLISILLSTGCGSNYYLKRSKVNLAHAVALGAKLDSTKTIIHDTVTIDKIHDRIVKETKIDTVKLKELCPEVKTPVQKKALQKVVCPDVLKDTTYTLYAKVQNKKYPLRIHVIASSIQGTAILQVDSKDLEIPFTSESIQVTAKPEKVPGFFQKAGIALIWFVLGALTMFIVFVIKRFVTISK